jgi:hypothetical protein
MTCANCGAELVSILERTRGVCAGCHVLYPTRGKPALQTGPAPQSPPGAGSDAAPGPEASGPPLVNLLLQRTPSRITTAATAAHPAEPA